MATDSNNFTFLDQVRDRRTMYVESLSDLQSLIWGYYVALSQHGIVEPVPAMNHHFEIWVYYRTGWSAALGWAKTIERDIQSSDEQFKKFFSLVDEYKRLRPVALSVARLKSHHAPSGRRVKIGLGERMENPVSVEIIRYKPAPLHFLRFHYKDRIDDDRLLMKDDGSYRTTLRDAKRWVSDELQVKPGEWEAPT